MSTKLEVYNACELTYLLYSCETWVVYRRHLKQLERFHQRCLRSILGIHWITHTPDTEVLEKANTISIEAHIHRHRLRWVGHVIRLDDDRIPKQLLYGELSVGSRPQHKPKKRFKTVPRTHWHCAKLTIPTGRWWHVTEIGGERWYIVDPVASKTMRISGLNQREHPEKVTISTQTCHSLSVKSVDEYVCQAHA